MLSVPIISQVCKIPNGFIWINVSEMDYHVPELTKIQILSINDHTCCALYTFKIIILELAVFIGIITDSKRTTISTSFYYFGMYDVFHFYVHLNIKTCV